MWVRNFVAGVLPAVATFAALAQGACPCGSGTRVVEPQLTVLLANRTVCGSAGGDSWQEFHSGSTASGGPLIDYKKGPQDAVDPTQTVGTWGVSNDVVTYTYPSAGAYQFAVCQADNNTLNFCGAARNVTGARLINGQAACSGSTAAQQLRSSRPINPLLPAKR